MHRGSTQGWDPGGYAANARFVSDLALPLLDLLAARPGERILDLGCGDGVLAERIGQAGCDVVGVDASAAMVAAARGRGVAARQGDGQMLEEVLADEPPFDAVFSNAALHWMPDPAAVLRGVAAVLKPGGRFVGEFGGQGNVERIVAALEGALRRRGLAVPSPWFFPDAEAYRELLTAHGFLVRQLRLFPRPTPLPGDLGGWLATFAQPFSGDLPMEERQPFLAEVIAALAPTLRDGDGRWVADYVRLRFVAVRQPFNPLIPCP
jgi:trans-aconitate methyltransferase